jgi:hypothetical protein
MSNWDKILKDFSHKCKGGAPDLKNSTHLQFLRESLIKFGWTENATNEFIGNLREAKKEDWWSKKSPEEQADYIKKHPKSKKAIQAKKEKEEKDKKKKGKDKKEEEPKKDKTLSEVDEDYYDTDVQPNDKDYDNNKPPQAELKEGASPITRKEIEKLFGTGVPKKYVDVLLRMLNSSSNGGRDHPEMSRFLNGVGAGEMPAQAAEVFTMMAATMGDKEFKQLMDRVRQNNSNMVNPKDAMFDEGWLQSISGARKVIRDFAESQGTEISHAAWDVRGDVEAMGLPYGNKGFSTDAYFRTADGQLIEVSLKKDTKIFLSQPSVGFVKESAISTLPKSQQRAYEKNENRIDELRKKKPYTKEDKAEVKKLQAENLRREKVAADELYGVDNPANPFYAQRRQQKSSQTMGYEISSEDKEKTNNLSDDDIESMSGTQSLPRKAFPPKYLKAVRDMVGSIEPPVTPRKIRRYLKDNPDAKKLVKDAYNPKYYAKAMLAYNKMLASTGDEKAQKRVDNHMEITKDFEKEFLGTTLDRTTPAGKVMYDNVMDLIGEKFPLQSIMSGEEKMALGGLAASPEVFASMFGNNPKTGKPYTYDELETKLKLDYVDPPGEHRLLFEGADPPITICEFGVRNRGKGYNELNTSNLEMKIPETMQRNLYCHNMKLAMKKGQSEEQFRKGLSTDELKNQDKLERGTKSKPGLGKCSV